MYKLLSKVIYLFYRYYSSGGTKRIPLQSSLFAVTFLIGMHILQIKILFWGNGGIISGETKIQKFIYGILFLLPIYIFRTPYLAS